MRKSLIWYLRRHPLLYEARFRLLSKNASIDRAENFCYNSINKAADIPEIYFELNPLIFDTIKVVLSDIDKAQQIAIWLRNNIKGGPGLGKSSAIALRKMINGEGGVCSDFSQVFNNFCVINDLKVKEWGLKVISNDPTLKGGHAFNEVYSKELQKWFIIDVSKSLLFYPINPAIPLSIFDLVTLKNKNEKVSFSCFNKNTVPDCKRITDIYITSDSAPFLITNYSNKTYDLYLNKLNFLPEPIVHGLLFLLGKSYAFEFPKYK